jgi:hypothetical protein
MTGMAAGNPALSRAGLTLLRARILRKPEADRPSEQNIAMRAVAEGSRVGRPSFLPFARALASLAHALGPESTGTKNRVVRL